MHPIRSRRTIAPLALAAFAATLGTAPGSDQQAAARPLDHNSLALREDVTLAPPIILPLASDTHDISQVIEDQDGAERRQDTTTAVTYQLQAEAPFAKDSAHLSSPAHGHIAAVARAIAAQSPARVCVFGYTRQSRPRHTRCRPVSSARLRRDGRAGRATPAFCRRLRNPRPRGATPSRLPQLRSGPPKEPASRDHLFPSRSHDGASKIRSAALIRGRNQRTNAIPCRHLVPRVTGYAPSCTSEVKKSHWEVDWHMRNLTVTQTHHRSLTTPRLRVLGCNRPDAAVYRAAPNGDIT